MVEPSIRLLMNLLQKSMHSLNIKIHQNPIEYKIKIGNGIIKEALSDINNIANYDKALIIHDSIINLIV